MLKHHGQSNLEKKRVHLGPITPEERVHLQHVREERQQVGILAGTPENSHLSPQARSRDSELEMVLGWETSKPTSNDAFLLANLPKWCCQLGTKLSNPEPGRVWVCVCVVGGIVIPSTARRIWGSCAEFPSSQLEDAKQHGRSQIYSFLIRHRAFRCFMALTQPWINTVLSQNH